MGSVEDALHRFGTRDDDEDLELGARAQVPGQHRIEASAVNRLELTEVKNDLYRLALERLLEGLDERVAGSSIQRSRQRDDMPGAPRRQLMRISPGPGRRNSDMVAPMG